MFSHKSISISLLFSFTLVICQSCDPKTQPAESVYLNGNILTMDDNRREVEALAVTEGRISAIGSRDDIQKMVGNATEVVDLDGKTLLPGFIDAHSHIAMAMRTIRWADLNAPPVGNVNSISSLIDVLSIHQSATPIKPGEWILGWGYDPDQLQERRHPSRRELSSSFPDNPVLLLHVSGHMAVVNDAALDKANITRETPDPSGGRIIKELNSEIPNGLLQEKAMYLVLPLLPVPGPAELANLFLETQDYYAQHGITTAQDGLTDYQTYGFLKTLAEQKLLKLDIEVLASFNEASQFFKDDEFGRTANGLRLTGLKVVADGSPQGKTAFFREPYLTEVPGCVHACVGIPTVQDSTLFRLMSHCYANNIQLYVHANGDASIDMLLKNHESVTEALDMDEDGQRTVVIHSQFVGMDQLSKFHNYGFIPSFFSNHAFFWGDVHVQNLGLERASFLSPLKTSADMGIIATNHTDFTITPINQMFLLWTAVNRQTRSGNVLGVEEQISPWEGLKAITINSAYQHRLESEKGSIEVGKLADLVILDQNPLTVQPELINKIQVVKTIKEGETIFELD